MSRRNFIIIVLILLAVIGVLGWYFFFRTSPTEPNQGNTTDNGNLFPFPDGQGTNTATSTGSTTNPVVTINNGTEILPALRSLWKDPTAGAGFVSSSTQTVSVRFVDRSTGHIYETPVESTGQEKLSNVTIPQIYEALWSNNGASVIMRYLKDTSTIQTFYGVLSNTASSTASTTEDASPLDGYFLTSNIRDVAVAAGKILYFDPTSSNGVLIEANVDGSNKRAVMTSDTTQWLISRNGSKTAFLSTKPSGSVGGYGYTLDIASGVLKNIMSDIPGLTGTINPSGEYVFMSGAQGKGMASASYSIATGKTLPLSLSTLSDKCAWSNTRSTIIYCAVPGSPQAGTYPDDWYQGNISFSDTVWKIDMSSGETTVVFDPQFDALQSMDIFRMSVSPDDTYLLFTNKKDMSLWLYRL